MWPRKRRARAIPSDFDPVYPYEKEDFVISAPFVNTDRGLTTDPPGFVAIKAKPPLSFDNQGNLILVGGSSGVSIDSKKGLGKSGNTIFAKVAEPAIFDQAGNITIGVDESRGLAISGGKLTARVHGPISYDPNGYIMLEYDNTKGLEVNNNQLGLKVDPAALTFTQGMLTLAPGAGPQQIQVDTSKGLTMTGNVISAKVHGPISFERNGYIALEYDNTKGLSVENNKLFVKTLAPLTVSNNGIGLNDTNYAKLTGGNTFSHTQIFNYPIRVQANATSVLGRGIQLGFGGADGYILADEGAKVLYFKRDGHNGRIAAMDLQGITRIKNVPPPEEDSDAVSRWFVHKYALLKDQNVDMKNFKIINLGDPVNDTDAVNKRYVDGKVSGATGPVLNLNQSGNTAPVVSFNNANGDRQGYVGFANDQSTNLKVQSNGNLYLECLSNTAAIVSQNPFRYSGDKMNSLGGGIIFTPAAGLCYLGCSNTATLKFRDPDRPQGRIGTLDLDNETRIVNLPAPVNPNDAATKSYVDSSAGGVAGPVLTLTQSASGKPLVKFVNSSGRELGSIGFESTDSDSNLQITSIYNLNLMTNNSNTKVYSTSPFYYAGGEMCAMGSGIYFAGDGTNKVFLSPTGGTMSLLFRNPTNDSSRFLYLNLEGRTAIVNAPNPLRDGDLVNLGSMRTMFNDVVTRTNKRTTRTLWTGPRPFSNARPVGTQPFDHKMALSLSASGGSVIGTLYLEAHEPYEALPLETDQLVFHLLFDETGNLQGEQSSLDLTHWGLRDEDEGEKINKKMFMPDPEVYPVSNWLPANTIKQRVYVDDGFEPVDLTLRLNAFAPYSLTFTFSGLTRESLRGKRLLTPTINFSYIAPLTLQ
uniref:Adenovirus fiber protein n=1 Tax=Pipistrellus pipistrellus adenovirus TaxID=3140007 RepID=A0AAU6S544_9ADEN